MKMTVKSYLQFTIPFLCLLLHHEQNTLSKTN